MSNTRDVLLEYMRRVDQAWNTADTPRIDDLLSRLETPCSSSHSPQKLNGSELSAHSSRSCSHGSVDTSLDESHATDPLAAAKKLMAERGVEVIDLTKLGCGYRVKKSEGYWHQREKRHYDEWPNATQFESESAAILAWLEAQFLTGSES
jgi:hypothetical protein